MERGKRGNMEIRKSCEKWKERRTHAKKLVNVQQGCREEGKKERKCGKRKKRKYGNQERGYIYGNQEILREEERKRRNREIETQEEESEDERGKEATRGGDVLAR